VCQGGAPLNFFVMPPPRQRERVNTGWKLRVTPEDGSVTRQFYVVERELCVMPL